MADSEAQGAGGVFWWQGDDEPAPTGPFHKLMVARELATTAVTAAVTIAVPAEARAV